MGDLFDRNLETLEGRYPDLAEKLRHFAPPERYRRVAGPTGLWDLARCEEGAETLFYGVPDPLQDAFSYWKQKRLRNPALLVFLGLDLGYRLTAKLANPDPNTQAYLLVERDLGIFHHFLHVMDVAPLVNDPRVLLFVDVPPEQLFVELRAVLEPGILFTLVKATVIEGNSVSYRLHTDYYKRWMVAYRDAVGDLLSFSGNSPLDTFIGIRHMLLNVETIARTPGINQLFDQFHDRPAVVIATGPSLDKNFHLLKEIQDRALLLSVDASFKFLLRNGIQPHFVTCLERIPYSATFFDGIPPEQSRHSVQLATPVVVPEVYSVYSGPKAILYRSLIHFQWLRNEKGTLATGHSSANMAFKLAEALGCNPILLVGQDLAYGDDGSSHATVDTLTPHNLTDVSKAIRVRGNVQESVRTSDAWEMFRACYVRDVAGYRGTVINATEGGAFIDGTQVMTLREAIDGHVGEPFFPAREIESRLTPPTEEEASAYLNWVRTVHVPETVTAIDKVITTYGAMSRRASRALEKGSSPGKIPGLLQEAYSLWLTQMAGDPIFKEAAFQVLQSTLVQVRTEYFDIPNRLNQVDQVHRARLKLVADCMRNMVAMLERLKSLYLDPAGTPAS